MIGEKCMNTCSLPEGFVYFNNDDIKVDLRYYGNDNFLNRRVDGYNTENVVILTQEAKTNRIYLKEVMENCNFKSYSEEWWHFTLNNEPFPNTYFDFPVA